MGSGSDTRPVSHHTPTEECGRDSEIPGCAVPRQLPTNYPSANPIIADCLLDFIGWYSPKMTMLWEAERPCNDTGPLRTQQATVVLASGWDVTTICKVSEISSDWRLATLRGRAQQSALTYQLPWRSGTDPPTAAVHCARRQGPSGLRLLRDLQYATPSLLTNIALNGCALIREGHIDSLIRNLYEHFPNVTLIGLRDMDYAVTSRAAKTTLICHTKASDSVALMHLLTLHETRDMHRDSTHHTDVCCGALLRSLGRVSEAFWLMHCLTNKSCRTTGERIYYTAADPVDIRIKDNLMTRSVATTTIREELDVFESPLFLNLAQGHARRTEAPTGDLPHVEAPLCRGPRIRLDLGTESTAYNPKPWARWGHLAVYRRGIDQMEVLYHMPARAILQAHLERYEGHWESTPARCQDLVEDSWDIAATGAIGFVAHLTPMDLGRNPSTQDLANLQALEMWMREFGFPPTNNQQWPPDPSEQPPPLSSRGGLP